MAGNRASFANNISEVVWQHGTGQENAYAFAYDGIGRMTGSEYFCGQNPTASSSFTERNISYDLNGNMLALQRLGNSPSLPENLSFTYNGNRLASMNGAAYSYDSNGNMT